MRSGQVTPPGRDARAWNDCLRRTARTSIRQLQRHLAVPTTATLLVVAAHPDDETIGAGRLVRAWVAAGGAARTLVLTDGEACFDGLLPASPAAVARWRIDEWVEATSRLGFSARSRAGLPDGRLWREDERTEEVILDVVRRIPGPVLVAAPMPEDPHPDHAAAGAAAHRAARQLAVGILWYPIWFAYWSDDQTIEDASRTLMCVSCTADDEAAWRHALDSYGSQLRPVPPLTGPVVPADLLERYPCQVVSLPPIAPGQHPEAANEVRADRGPLGMSHT